MMQKIIIDYITAEFMQGQEDLSLTAEDDLLMTGLIDSIGMMKLIAFIEQKFEVKVQPQDMTIENFINVEAIGLFIENQQH